MKSNLVNLNCVVLGDDSSHIFTVEIALTDNNVYDLKEAIKPKKHITFRDVDAASLRLWKVDIDPEKEKLDLPPDVEELMPFIPLSEVFTVGPEAGHLHIFVQCMVVQPLPAASHPFIKIQCVVVGDDLKRMFPINIAQTDTVGHLKKAIKPKKHIFRDVDADSLQLWKVDIDPMKEKLDLPPDVEELMPFTPLSEVFPVEPKAKHLHIFVQRPPHGPRIHLQLSPSAQLRRIQQLRSEYCRNFAKMAPSRQRVPSQFEGIQNNPAIAVRWDRPSEAASIIPCTLLHPAFGAFMDDCENHEPTADDNNLAMALSNAMSHFATNEVERASKFRQVLRKYSIELVDSTVDDTPYTTDGDVQHKGFRFAIAKVESEIGSTNSEPHMEALSYYIHSTNPFAQDKPAFRFPCILISLFGPCMDFSAAVWDTRPNMQVISTALPLYYHRTDTKMREMVGRHVGALKKALHSLLKCYESMASSTTTPSTDTDPCFPYPSSYTCIKTSATCRFKYHAQMDAQKLLFSVKTTDDKTLCIKFVRHYSKEVHQRCASGGFAPALYGFENLPGGWFMIVMEMITEDYCCLGELSAPYPHHDALATKLQSLHQDGYVHGDIRDTNIMVKRDRSPGFKLVDFDWSGKIGEIRYPMNVYRGGRLWRPDGAEDGQLILAEHDIQMLHAMFPPGSFL